MDKKGNITSVRFTDEQLKRLEVLAEMSGCTRSEVLQEMVDAQYDKVMGNPKLKMALEQMKALQEQVRGLQELM